MLISIPDIVQDGKAQDYVQTVATRVSWKKIAKKHVENAEVISSILDSIYCLEDSTEIKSFKMTKKSYIITFPLN